MVVRKTVRREVRLDDLDNRRLEQELQRRDMTFADWVRDQIGREKDAAAEANARRIAAAEALTSMNIDFGWDPNDPDPATTLLREAYEERYHFPREYA
jgi:hypothetical protein